MTPTQWFGAFCVLAGGLAVLFGVHRVGGRLELPAPAPREPQPARALGCRCGVCRPWEFPRYEPTATETQWSAGDEGDVQQAVRLGNDEHVEPFWLAQPRRYAQPLLRVVAADGERTAQ